MPEASGPEISAFGSVAKGLSRNPLGIIALFIVLVYGIACLLIVVGRLDVSERFPIIWFIVLFPTVVLFIFTWLVVSHGGKLFAPSDYRDEANFMRMQLATAVSLAAATSKSDVPSSPASFSSIVDTVQSTAYRSASAGRKLRRLLWVDDNPDNNFYERRAFEGIGLEITIARSTDEGLSYARNHEFHAIISDMGRQEGPREGYVLLDALRAFDEKTPFFFYASSNSPAHKAETARHGGQGCTNDPQELFESVTRAILHSA